MDLKTYLASDDPNEFWRMQCGDHENLLDEALEQLEAKDKELENAQVIIYNLEKGIKLAELRNTIDRLQSALKEAYEANSGDEKDIAIEKVYNPYNPYPYGEEQ